MASEAYATLIYYWSMRSTYLRTHRSEVDRHVRVRYCSARDIRLDSVAALMEDAHPEMHNRDVATSRAARAEEMAARALGIPSILQPDITLPLAGIEALNTEQVSKQPGKLAGELQKALAMLDKPCGVGIMKLAAAFGMMASKHACEQTVDGKRVRNLFKRVTLKLHSIKRGDECAPVMHEVLQHYKLRAGDTYLLLSDYPEYSRLLDCDQAEQAYTSTMRALNRDAAEVATNDTRFESIDRAALQQLYATVDPYTDPAARRAVDLMTREALPHPEFDDVLQIQTSYHRKYDFGRRYGNEPSLQMTPRRVRGALAARFYHDIDMENAHDHIMHQIALSHEIELEAVRRVVIERESVLQGVQAHYYYRCGRAAAKELLIAVLNGGDANSWVQDEKVAIDEELVRRIADPNDDLGHAEIVEDLLMECARMQDIMFKKYGSKLETLMACVQRARPEKIRLMCVARCFPCVYRARRTGLCKRWRGTMQRRATRCTF